MRRARGAAGEAVGGRGRADGEAGRWGASGVVLALQECCRTPTARGTLQKPGAGSWEPAAR
ncbi:MAG: hypothetical protein AVDCRST_MAG57-3490 [uncultured Blastococcus sp.]|uniref:Uncharacterized protein n=1 Tax=uncultured Blastococcus sp. TaxID=217144 RepID=A0A6J4JGG8_9ACTN|nr:MAG: hypothetical protein AVDCRST_MAG57-3490 [uncultured Blastococcus sp.]